MTDVLAWQLIAGTLAFALIVQSALMHRARRRWIEILRELLRDLSAPLQRTERAVEISFSHGIPTAFPAQQVFTRHDVTERP